MFLQDCFGGLGCSVMLSSSSSYESSDPTVVEISDGEFPTYVRLKNRLKKILRFVNIKEVAFLI